MTVYRTKGTLTGVIDSENVSEAQQYLRDDAMVQYVGANAKLVDELAWITWELDADGHHWQVTAVTNRELTEDELKRLSSEVSGQNSDGLGEGFEQQSFAWEPDGECGECAGCEYNDGCESEDGRMISFDWETNDCTFKLVQA